MNKSVFLLLVFSLLLIGCYGSPVHMSSTYNSRQSDIARNNKNLLSLKIAMTQEQVLKLMEQPERSEGYRWGSAWLYRTAMTTGVYGTADSDFTPLVFDAKGILQGWGRNFFTEYVKHYEITVK